MIRYNILPLLLLVSSMTTQIKGMEPQKTSSSISQEEEVNKVEKVGDLPKELRHEITSYALALRENPKYELYKKFNVGSPIRAIALSEDTTRALTASDDGVIRLWDVEEEKILKELKGHTEDIRSVALSAHGTIAVTGSVDGTVRVWSTVTEELELLKSFQVGSCVHSVALSADGSIALTGSENRTVRVWNTLTGELLENLHLGSCTFITSVALSADGTSAAIGTAESKVLVWNIKTGLLLNTLWQSNCYVMAVALSKDGKRVITNTDGTLKVWNAKPLPGKHQTHIPLIALKGHNEQVTALAFGGNNFIASGSADGTALIWKTFALKHHWSLEEQGKIDWKDLTVQERGFWETFKETFYNPEKK